jgi:hypothetical protein
VAGVNPLEKSLPPRNILRDALSLGLLSFSKYCYRHINMIIILGILPSHGCYQDKIGIFLHINVDV